MQNQPALPATIPGNFNTVRATAVYCEVDGGSFVISFGELRPVVAHTPYDKFSAEKSAFIEISRIAMSPITFIYLLQTVTHARENYEQVFGKLPDLDEVRSRLQTMIPDVGEREVAEQRIGFRS